MALPALNTPTYTLELPSTNEIVEFRPFLVKEHKILMSLSKSSYDEVSRVVKDVINVCTFNKLDLKNLPSFDIEYLFVNLRAKSIGEKIAININCEKCDTKIKTNIDLNNVKVIKSDKNISNKVLIRDNTGITLNYPKFEEIVKAADDISDKSQIFDLVASCIDNVFVDDKVYDDFTQKEAQEFLSQFTQDEFAKIEGFFESIPKVILHIESTCPKCEHVNKSKLQGLQNFFV